MLSDVAVAGEKSVLEAQPAQARALNYVNTPLQRALARGQQSASLDPALAHKEAADWASHERDGVPR